MRYELGSNNLKAEHSWQIDCGWDFSSSIASLQLQLFASFIDNYIYSARLNDVVTDDLPTYQFQQGDARLLGAEAAIDIHPVEQLHFKNSFYYVNARQLHQPEDDFIRDGRTFNNLFFKVGLECNLRQDNFYAANNTETATPGYTLLSASAGTDFKVHGRKVCSLYIIGENLTDKAYQNHLSRLKYLDVEGRPERLGLYNMGRNITFKLVFPIL